MPGILAPHRAFSPAALAVGGASLSRAVSTASVISLMNCSVYRSWGCFLAVASMRGASASSRGASCANDVRRCVICPTAQGGKEQEAEEEVFHEQGELIKCKMA